MQTLSHLLENNAKWSQAISEADPSYFPRLAKLQKPTYLWIGCADSRVPANQIVGLDPGELFVHRNVANVVVHSDLNCLSVIQYAVEALQVKHIIVCGHYNCGGVAAALENPKLGLIDNWLRHIQDIRDKHQDHLKALDTTPAQCDRLCELNVINQVANVCSTTIVRDAWERDQSLSIHGWIYGLADGRLRDLGMCVSNHDELVAAYQEAIESTRGANRVSLPEKDA